MRMYQNDREDKKAEPKEIVNYDSESCAYDDAECSAYGKSKCIANTKY